MTSSLASAMSISSKTLVRYMCHMTTKVGARIAVDMGESLGIIFDGRASGTHHFVAVYGLFAKEETLQQVLHAISPA
ncbi:hypothetical protein PC128_g8842 [Phytophthora cactorum]|nr:hypothetical protein PC128_g8842 [Phytophthora cactorum]KAG4048333.1 hypothetical protein PC123_g16354 [Phytophthora cactorum]